VAESDFTSFLRSVVETLEELGLTYMVCGSVATTSIWTEERLSLV